MLKLLLKVAMPAIFAVAVLCGGAQSAFAQNMQGTVVKKTVKFAKGKSQATIPGMAKYGMSYVFDLGASAGQTMEIGLAGKNSQLTFSLIAPDDETIEDAFSVSEWTGVLPQSGKYSIVVVMNDQKAASVPFSLKIRIN